MRHFDAPEVILPGERSTALVYPHLFATQAKVLHVIPGLTLDEIFAQSGLPLATRPFVKAWIEGEEVPRAFWGRVRLKEGACVAFKAAPAGGGLGDALKSVGAILVAVAALVFAPQIAAPIIAELGLGAFAGGLLTAGIGAGIVLGGNFLVNLAVNALIPPPRQTPGQIGSDGGNQLSSSPTYALTGVQNRMNPYGPIPRVIGRRRVFPVFAARPYSETEGDQQYVRCLLCVGYGPLRIHTVSLGETPIFTGSSDDGGDFVTILPGNEIEVREGWDDDDPITLFTTSIRETGYNSVLNPRQEVGSGILEADGSRPVHAEATMGLMRTSAVELSEVELGSVYTRPFLKQDTLGSVWTAVQVTQATLGALRGQQVITSAQLGSVTAVAATKKFTFTAGDPIAQFGLLVGDKFNFGATLTGGNANTTFTIVGFSGASNRIIEVSETVADMASDASWSFSLQNTTFLTFEAGSAVDLDATLHLQVGHKFQFSGASVSGLNGVTYTVTGYGGGTLHRRLYVTGTIPQDSTSNASWTLLSTALDRFYFSAGDATTIFGAGETVTFTGLPSNNSTFTIVSVSARQIVVSAAPTSMLIYSSTFVAYVNRPGLYFTAGDPDALGFHTADVVALRGAAGIVDDVQYTITGFSEASGRKVSVTPDPPVVTTPDTDFTIYRASGTRNIHFASGDITDLGVIVSSNILLDDTGTANDDQTFRVIAISDDGRSIEVTPEPALMVQTSGYRIWAVDPSIVETRDATAEVGVEVGCLQGLVSYDTAGNRVTRTVEVAVQYRAVGATVWNDVAWVSPQAANGTLVNGKLQITDSTTSSTRRGGRFLVPTPGRYEVKLQRLTDAGDSRTFDKVTFVALKSIINENPINMDGLCLIALRLKATDELNNYPDTLNVIAESYLPEWDGAAFSYQLCDEFGANPAWGALDMLRRRGTEVVMEDDRIRLDHFLEWAEANDETSPNADEPRHRINAVYEGGSIYEAFKDIASYGRAAPTTVDGLYSVIRDVPQDEIAQHISPKNSWDYRGSKAFSDLPHAFRVRFLNPDIGWKEDEVIVYADGYNETNATVFETLELQNCTSPTQAYRDARYHLAVGRLRPEVHQITMDVEGLRCTAGSKVAFAHDVISVGLTQGRIEDFIVDGSITHFVLDETVTMVSGKSYAARVRKSDGSSVIYNLVNEEETSHIVALAVGVEVEDGPEAGDLYLFGEADAESASMVVKRVDSAGDFNVRLTLVDEAPAIQTADTGIIPEFITHITKPDDPALQRPAAPEFTLLSDETVAERMADGTLVERIRVAVSPPGLSSLLAVGYEVQFKQSTDSIWRQATPNSPVSNLNAFIVGVVHGIEYDVRVRFVTGRGVASDWTVETEHEVVGFTTPPSAVPTFTSQRFADGVQLSWTPPPEVDVTAYNIRRGASWDAGTDVAIGVTGTTLFVALDTPDDVTFWIKAVDVVGLQSETPVSLVTSVVPPDTPTEFDVYPQGGNLRFVWDTVSGSGMQYEIREGESWLLGTYVLRSGGDTATLLYPVAERTPLTFWIKALSPAGLYSDDAIFSNTVQLVEPFRNLVLQRDFSTEDFPEVYHDFEEIGSGEGSALQVAKDGIYNEARADWYAPVDLGAPYAARSWFDGRTTVTGGTDLTWATANRTWAGSSDLTWLGIIEDVEGIASPISIAVEQAVEALDASLIEGFRFDESLPGVRGTEPDTAVGVSYAPAHFSNGLYVKETTEVDFTVDVPAVFSKVFDLRYPSLLAEDHVVATLKNGDAWLRIAYLADGDIFRLEGSDLDELILSVPREAGDVITFGVSQSVSTRSFFAATRKNRTILSTSSNAGPVGNFHQVALHGV